MTIKATIFTYRPHVSLAWFTFGWWRQNWWLMTSQWPDNCDAVTWIVISNSLDIDLIHGNIHGRSCKKHRYFISCCRYLIPCYKNSKIRPVPGGFVCCASFKFWWMFCLITWRKDVGIFHFIYFTEAKWRTYGLVENAIVASNDSLSLIGRQVII